MKTIHKFPLDIKDHQKIKLPIGAKFVACAEQGGIICIWCWVDTDAEDFVFHDIYIFGTGNPIPKDLIPQSWAFSHLGTVVMPVFVWHVFTTTQYPNNFVTQMDV